MCGRRHEGKIETNGAGKILPGKSMRRRAGSGKEGSIMVGGFKKGGSPQSYQDFNFPQKGYQDNSKGR